MIRAYYNEIDPYAAQWIRNLIAAGLVSPGDVDERDIRDVLPSDLHGYTRCHFFAGIAVWDYALNRAGWPDDRPIWTGSCPCQPFSAAGGRGGFADERHVWPSWHHLIRECRPPIVAGEQVASKDGLSWLDLVQADLEGSGYACGAIDLCAAGVGAPHIRQREWFVAVAAEQGLQGRLPAGERSGSQFQAVERGGAARPLAYAAGERRHGSELAGAPGAAPAGGTEAYGRRPARVREPAGYGAAIELGDAPRLGREGRQSLSGPGARRVDAGAGANGLVADADGRDAGAEGLQRGGQHGLVPQDGGAVPYRWPGAHHGGWDDADWLLCRDDKWRPVEPGTFPLVDGASFRLGSSSPFEGKSRSGMLKGYGNAINAEAATAFIEACLEVIP